MTVQAAAEVKRESETTTEVATQKGVESAVQKIAEAKRAKQNAPAARQMMLTYVLRGKNIETCTTARSPSGTEKLPRSETVTVCGRLEIERTAMGASTRPGWSRCPRQQILREKTTPSNKLTCESSESRQCENNPRQNRLRGKPQTEQNAAELPDKVQDRLEGRLSCSNLETTGGCSRQFNSTRQLKKPGLLAAKFAAVETQLTKEVAERETNV